MNGKHELPIEMKCEYESLEQWRLVQLFSRTAHENLITFRF